LCRLIAAFPRQDAVWVERAARPRLEFGLAIEQQERAPMSMADQPLIDRRRLLVSGACLGAASLAQPVPGVPHAMAQPVVTEGYADGDGIRLFFIRAGDGSLMLFLHGNADDGMLYFRQLQEFGRDHLAVAPNLRGFAPSDQPPEIDAYAMPRSLGDVRALLRYFGRERCVLVGNDWGGYIAWVFASAYPSHVDRLIILNAPHPAIHLRQVRNDPAQNRASQYERGFDAAVAPYPRWYNYYKADPIKVPPSVNDTTQTGMPDLAVRFFASVAEPPATTSLKLSVPTLVIWGMNDPYTLPGQLDGLEEFVSNITVLRIEDAGHLPMQSHPDLVNRAIRDFLVAAVR
jgi:epoxide hydrolase 4